MNTHLIKKEEWKDYFDFTSKNLSGQEVELEVIGLDIGDQIEEEWAHLDGFTYEPKEDILFVHTATTDHPIENPLEIVATEEGSIIRSIAVKDGEGKIQILNFRIPVKIGSRTF